MTSRCGASKLVIKRELVLVALAIVLAIVLHRSVFGRRIFIVGGNPVTGRLFGIRSDLVITTCYVIPACLAAVAGLILSGYVGLVDNWVGQGYELDSIVACVVGQVSLPRARGPLRERPPGIRRRSQA